jgi:hypothetical protein
MATDTVPTRASARGDLRHAVGPRLSAPTHYPAARIAPREGEPPQMPVRNVVDVTHHPTRTGAGPGHIGPSSVTATAGTAECRRRRATRIERSVLTPLAGRVPPAASNNRGSNDDIDVDTLPAAAMGASGAGETGRTGAGMATAVYSCKLSAVEVDWTFGEAHMRVGHRVTVVEATEALTDPEHCCLIRIRKAGPGVAPGCWGTRPPPGRCWW